MAKGKGKGGFGKSGGGGESMKGMIHSVQSPKMLPKKMSGKKGY